MRILVVGSGAREHALAWALAQSPQQPLLWCAPGNPGMALLPRTELLPVGVRDVAGLCAAAREQQIDLVVVGPEEPLARGLTDALLAEVPGVAVFGPSAAGAHLEASKAWAKEIMAAAGVPTGRAEQVDSLEAALDVVADAPLPMVIKADGLAAGKGVVICQTRSEADAAVREMLEERALGEAGATVLIEEFLDGMEVSFLALTDGVTCVPLVPSCDYKRVGDADAGPNTGGMGAYTPPAAFTAELQAWTMTAVIEPVVAELRRRGIDYRGVLYAGLILTADGPKVLEFNCRFGDPETQVVLPMLASDLVAVCDAVARGTLAELPPLEWHAGACVGVVLASGGYPGAYASGVEIHGLDAVRAGDGLVFHAGTAAREADGAVVTAGGRVLTCVARGADMAAARDAAYAVADAISFDGAIRRSDIAAREVVAVAG